MARELIGYLVLEDEAVGAGEIEPLEGSYYEDEYDAKSNQARAGKGWSIYELSRKERT